VATSYGGEGAARVLRVVAMLRAAALLCAAMLVHVIAARALPEHTVSACGDDDADAGYAPTADEALAARWVVLGFPASSRQTRWDGLALLPGPSPAPDEILHVPKPLVA
jgi:hypothetical protein